MEFVEVKGLDKNIHKYCPEYVILIYLINDDKYYLFAQCTNDKLEDEELFRVSKTTYNKIFNSIKDPVEICALDILDLTEKLISIRQGALDAIRPISIEFNLTEKIPKYLREEK